MNNNKCMILACPRPRALNLRGLCPTCYGRAKAKVEAKETTWQELANLGLVTPEDGREFDEALNKARGDRGAR